MGRHLRNYCNQPNPGHVWCEVIKGVEADHTIGKLPYSFFRTEALSVRSFTTPTSKLTKEV